MRLSYYGYFLRHKMHFGKHLVDLSPFIKSFAACTEPVLKGSFRHNDEHVYLNAVSGNVCILAMTRNSEALKMIDTSQMSIREFKKLLGQDEKVGFASYLIIKKNFFGFASSSLSPKFDVFCDLVNRLLSDTGNGSWEFCIQPLIHQATRDEAVKMDYIGKTTIEVKKENSLGQHILNVLNAGSDSEDVDSISITIKPLKRKNIKRVVEKLIDHTSDEGLEKLIIKAKNDASSAMMDLYVVGKGVISDIVGDHEESLISEIMENKIQENAKLKEQLGEFIANGQENEADLSDILHFNNVSAWANLATDLQQNYKLR